MGGVTALVGIPAVCAAALVPRWCDVGRWIAGCVTAHSSGLDGLQLDMVLSVRRPRSFDHDQVIDAALTASGVDPSPGMRNMFGQRQRAAEDVA